MIPDLRDVNAVLPDPPYPPGTKSNGWKPQLDISLIETSDTWVLACDDERPWLLRIWYEAWRSVPVGAMPSNRGLFARRIGCTQAFLDAHAEVLLRGWTLHSDENLYHQYIVQQVLAMSEQRLSTRNRVATWRNKKKQEDKNACNALVTPCNALVTPCNAADKDKDKEEEEEVLRTSRPQKEFCEPAADDPASLSPAEKRTPCPHKKIIALYHQHLPRNPEVRTWIGQRPKILQARWREHPDLEWWAGFLQYCGESRFLTGQVHGRGDQPPFLADLEWIVRPANFQKINEGKYHRVPKTS